MRYFIAVRHLKERASRNRGLTDSRVSGSQQRLPRRVPPPPPRLLRPSVAIIGGVPIKGRGVDRDKGGRRRGRGRNNRDIRHDRDKGANTALVRLLVFVDGALTLPKGRHLRQAVRPHGLVVLSLLDRGAPFRAGQ